MTLFWLKLIYIVGIGIGFGTTNQYPPHDPSAWLAMFCLGGLWSCFEIEEKQKEQK